MDQGTGKPPSTAEMLADLTRAVGSVSEALKLARELAIENPDEGPGWSIRRLWMDRCAPPAPPPPEREPEIQSLFGDDLPPPGVDPEFFQSIYVHFEDLDGLKAFGRLLGHPLTIQTRELTFPLALPRSTGVDG